MKLLLFLTFLLPSFSLNAECLKQIKELDFYKPQAISCLNEALEKKYDYLPQYLLEKINLCEINSSNSFDVNECYKNLVIHSQAVMTCEKNQKRQNQMALYDEFLFQAIIKEQTRADVPLELKEKIMEMAFQNKLDISIDAYHSKVLNAHAGAQNKILLSSGLWSLDSVLSNGEVMAIVAHELGHIKENHSLKLGCLAIEWVGVDHSLKEALEAFREDFSIESQRGQSFSRTSNNIEFRADYLAVSILKKAGYDPRLMGDVLLKLIPKDSSGMTSGSHPDTKQRAQLAYKYAEMD